MMFNESVSSGYLERKRNGHYEGVLSVDGVDLSPVEGVFFMDDGETYLWIKRKHLLEYDIESCTYIARKRNPQWQSYLKKDKLKKNYYGEFSFLHFKYSITGEWDVVLGKDKKRMNLYVTRLPMEQQVIIKTINDKLKGGRNGK